MHDLIIKNGTVVDPWTSKTADIGITAGKIEEIGPGLSGREAIDAHGKLVFPGVVDAHTHMALPVGGTRSSDDFRSGTAAAACGGVTTIVDFTVGAPGRTIPEAIDLRTKELQGAAVDVALHGEVIGWAPGREWEFFEAVERGVTSFKFYTAYEASGRRTPPPLLGRAMAALQELGAVAVVHAEDEGLIASLAARRTPAENARMSTLADARPDLCEQTAIAQVGRLSRETGCRTHIVHVSSKLGMQAVRGARADGAPVTAETCPQYLLLTRDVYEREDGHLFAASPALRTDEDRSALWTALRNRDLDLVATDHCPFTREQKAWKGSFSDLPYGLPGVETLLPLLYSEGVAKGILSVNDLPRLLSEGPAKVYGLYPQKGALEPGSDADLVIFDPNATWRISAGGLHMNTDFSPYEEREVTGREEMCLLRGRPVVRNGEPVGGDGQGRFLARRASAVA